MENNILILIKIISALYLNSLSEDKNETMHEEIEELLKGITTSNRAVAGLGTDDMVVEGLRDTVDWMLYNKDVGYSKQDLSQRLAINLQGSNEYIVIVDKLLSDEVIVHELSGRVSGIMNELRHNKTKSKLKKMVLVANAKLNFSGDYINTKEFVNDFITELSEIQSKSTSVSKSLIGKVNFDNDEDLEDALAKTIELTDNTGILNTGFIGLNKALGGYGIPRGAAINFAALSYNYKSGILADLFVNIPHYNIPWMWDASKRPLILNLTFENTLAQTLLIIYEKLYEIKTGKKCVMGKVDTAQARALIKEHTQVNGYSCHIEHYDPNNFSIYDIFELINDLLYAGYEIHAIICDYLSQVAPNTFGDRLDTKIAKTFEMIRNFCTPKGITFITAHQLSTEAQKYAKEYPTQMTRWAIGGGKYMDCQSLHTKLDIEVIQHIIQHIDGKSYLDIARGKHRCGGHNTPMAHRHFYLPFDEIGGIIPDYGKADRTLYSLPKVLDATVNWDE